MNPSVFMIMTEGMTKEANVLHRAAGWVLRKGGKYMPEGQGEFLATRSPQQAEDFVKGIVGSGAIGYSVKQLLGRNPGRFMDTRTLDQKRALARGLWRGGAVGYLVPRVAKQEALDAGRAVGRAAGNVTQRAGLRILPDPTPAGERGALFRARHAIGSKLYGLSDAQATGLLGGVAGGAAAATGGALIARKVLQNRAAQQALRRNLMIGGGVAGGATGLAMGLNARE